MLSNIFPRTVDNRLPGHWAALLFFVPALMLKAVIAVRSIISGEDVARNADQLPLDNYGAEGAQMVVSMFASLGWANALFLMFSVLVLARYRAMVPLVALFHLLGSIGGRMVGYLVPGTDAALAPGVGPILYAIAAAFLATIIIGAWPRSAAPVT